MFGFKLYAAVMVYTVLHVSHDMTIIYDLEHGPTLSASLAGSWPRIGF